MCVAIIGKVVKVHERTATVDYKGSRVYAAAGIIPVSVGDNVLVHAGCILQKVDDDYVDELEEIREEMFS